MTIAPHEPAAVEIASLRDQLAAARARSDENVRRHRSDIDKIGEALQREAEARNWCHEYDTFVTNLNQDLHVELPTRQADYQLDFTVTVHVTCNPSDLDDVIIDVQRDIDRMSFDYGSVTYANCDNSEQID